MENQEISKLNKEPNQLFLLTKQLAEQNRLLKEILIGNKNNNEKLSIKQLAIKQNYLSVNDMINTMKAHFSEALNKFFIQDLKRKDINAIEKMYCKSPQDNIGETWYDCDIMGTVITSASYFLKSITSLIDNQFEKQILERLISQIKLHKTNIKFSELYNQTQKEIIDFVLDSTTAKNKRAQLNPYWIYTNMIEGPVSIYLKKISKKDDNELENLIIQYLI